MSPAFFGFMVFLFAGMTFVQRMLEQAMLQLSDTTLMSTMTAFTVQPIWILQIPIINIHFFSQGVPALISMNYTYFGGNAGIFQWFLYALSAALVFGLFLTIIGTIFYYIARLI